MSRALRATSWAAGPFGLRQTVQVGPEVVSVTSAMSRAELMDLAKVVLHAATELRMAGFEAHQRPGEEY